ncbi:putative methyltransferase C9orf114 [Watersipora subatra]|uniref:putative methyltransferase C9orf114 n=1 Tax=Watersipora subatra TaxID=2589382 RepID=UPI00355BC948
MESKEASDSYSAGILDKLNKKKRVKNEEFVGFKEKRKEYKEQKRKWEEEKAMKKIQKRLDKEAKELEEERLRENLKRKNGRDWTLSIAVPGSIIENAQSDELRTYLAGQIGRAATVFAVDEIIVFDELKSITKNESGEFVSTSTNKRRNGCIMLAKVLQYLDCPQYLRKAFFPQQPDLKNAGLLNPLDAPHHLRADDWSDYREGVVRDNTPKEGKGSFVDIGLTKACQIDQRVMPGVRVTVKINPASKDNKKKYNGKAVAPTEPRTECGLYWGYKTRLVSCLSDVFSQCPHEGGYDLTIGTSERGNAVDDYSPTHSFKHALVVFGGLKGLEAAVEADDKLEASDPKELFDSYLNTCPGQGSGTIRTEEAILISLSALRPKLLSVQGTADHQPVV